MSLCNRAVLGFMVVLALSFLVGCGSSSPNNSVPPPSGGFSNTNLNGTYTFSISGADVDAAGETACLWEALIAVNRGIDLR